MPDRRQTSLKFPLEETVWFEKGHEVEDLLSISLDPNISILDEEEFVVLKGTLELSGEYHHSPESEAMEEFPGTGRNYMQNVEMRNDEIGEFSHRFPVDITIPKKRIENVGELEIEIYSFDYALPENNRLQVLADIYINGIYEDVEEEVDVPAEDLTAEDSLSQASEASVEPLNVELPRPELNEVEMDVPHQGKESDVPDDPPLPTLEESIEPLNVGPSRHEFNQVETDIPHQGKENDVPDDPSLPALEESIEPLKVGPSRHEFNQVEMDIPHQEKENDTSEQREEVEIKFFQEPKVTIESNESNHTKDPQEDETDHLYEPFEAEARMLPELEETEEKKEGVLSPFQHQFPNLTVNTDAESPEDSQVIEVTTEEENFVSLESSSLVDKEVNEQLETSTDRKIEEEVSEKETDPSTMVEQGPKLTIDSIDEEIEEEQEEEIRDDESSYFEESSSYDLESSSMMESPEESKEKKKKKKDKYQSISFADFFARKEEDSVSKMRVCLVQHGDSIENLADRYNLTTQQILRANHLETSDEVYEGQVLYIPNKIRPLKRE
ncbi:LysM peptidoglycan-binding domain-containing protein [Lederbergia sp. NSJ-179]|uniref:LysM peptidoglycan-binding domain-containing protein n=1 Tax=Lederbergia sp. NSJ-179 TaxID=2931402 RepID=UPI001FD53C9E|nr:LysM peptidoglycan-binding domain-containing protein [Lederbergia sp. NSJ-179]MCJ7839891.1 LysM peptidoglycan-binding domain-containing protein [Lederbergia sp. NSJ-179]